MEYVLGMRWVAYEYCLDELNVIWIAIVFLHVLITR
jgi:hypothetical protein